MIRPSSDRHLPGAVPPCSLALTSPGVALAADSESDTELFLAWLRESAYALGRAARGGRA